MESYDEYARTARVYTSVYAKRRAGQSENKESPVKTSPGKEVGGKVDEVLGSLTLNPQSEEHKIVKKFTKAHSHTIVEKKKWIKRI